MTQWQSLAWRPVFPTALSAATAQQARGQWALGSQCLWPPTPALIPIPHLISPQTSSHLKAAVSKSPLANASTQERFLPTPLEVYCPEPRFSARREPSSVPPTLCGLHAAPGREGREGGSQAALAQRCVSAQVPPKAQLVGTSGSWGLRWPGLEGIQRPILTFHLPPLRLKAGGLG